MSSIRKASSQRNASHRAMAIVVFVFCLMASLMQTATAAPIHIIASVYEPYRITPTTGIINEIVIAACQSAGLPIAEIEMLPTERARLKFENDPDAIYLEANSYVDTVKNPAYAITKQWPFQVSVYYDKSRFPDGAPKKLTDFAGKVMGYYRADLGTKDYFAKQGVSMYPLDQQAQLYTMLVHQRIDLLVSVEDNATLELDRLDPNWRTRIGIFGPYYSGWAGPVYHNDNPAAVDFITRYLDGYRRIQNDGTMRNILEHYYGKGHAPAQYFH